ncbi:MAG TPA: Clp protease N-terminal domain-containing protein [Streptosporangiaceae bacterium]
MAVLDVVSTMPTEPVRRWLRRRTATGEGEVGEPGESAEIRTTPAADISLSGAARLAGTQPVGSHHLLLAAIADADTAAARALVALGVDLDRARDALRNADVTGTSDEHPAEAGRRQMLIKVTDDKLTIEATDPVIVRLGQAALSVQDDQGGIIRGDLPVNASLGAVWQALHDSLVATERRANLPPDAPDSPDQPGTETA